MNRYDLMESSSQIDTEDNLSKDTYPDPLLLSINNNKQIRVKEHSLKSYELKRFWLTNYSIYKDTDYDDILLLFNNVPYVTMLDAGDILYLPNPEERT